MMYRVNTAVYGIFESHKEIRSHTLSSQGKQYAVFYAQMMVDVN